MIFIFWYTFSVSSDSCKQNELMQQDHTFSQLSVESIEAQITQEVEKELAIRTVRIRVMKLMIHILKRK